MAVINLIELVNAAFETVFETRSGEGQEVTFAVSLDEADFEDDEGLSPALHVLIALGEEGSEFRNRLTCKVRVSEYRTPKAFLNLANTLWDALQAKVLETSLMSMGPVDES